MRAPFLALALAALASAGLATAHPGSTDADGGHTCHTDCAEWGLSRGQYHTHGGTSSGGASDAPLLPVLLIVASVIGVAWWLRLR